MRHRRETLAIAAAMSLLPAACGDGADDSRGATAPIDTAVDVDQVSRDDTSSSTPVWPNDG